LPKHYPTFRKHHLFAKLGFSGTVKTGNHTMAQTIYYSWGRPLSAQELGIEGGNVLFLYSLEGVDLGDEEGW